ncbi:MAG TPA: M67 family metallopeptidase [Tepidisphaeraceae bacterium]|nr:M67 family metallopeptidase [Tepidisphaeraceae bacterium]
MNDLVLPSELARTIEREGSAAYPNECCGIMFGRDVGNERRVERLERVRNSYAADEQYHRFSIEPKDLMRAEKSAADVGQLVLGFYHSHPDHPARPSETDRQAAWPFYSYVIVSIGKGEPLDMTCWVLDAAMERFERQKIVEVSGGEM